MSSVEARCLASERDTVGWAEVIAILVIGRLCEPSSELHVAERWYRTTALEDLLGIAVEDIYDERLYRALDRLLPHKESARTASGETPRRALRSGLRSIALRCDEHLL